MLKSVWHMNVVMISILMIFFEKEVRWTGDSGKNWTYPHSSIAKTDLHILKRIAVIHTNEKNSQIITIIHCDIHCSGSAWYSHQWTDKETGGLENKRTNEPRSSKLQHCWYWTEYCEQSWRLEGNCCHWNSDNNSPQVFSSHVKYYQQTLVWKSLKENTNNTAQNNVMRTNFIKRTSITRNGIESVDHAMSSFSCQAISTDIPDPLSPPFPIDHHFW